MYLDENIPGTILLSFDGELIGFVKEADTSEGYVVQYRTEIKDGKLSVSPDNTIRRVGRVDFLGDTSKDSYKVIHERLNKIRAELGLEPYDASPILAE
jgi:hypothetical protein